MEIKRSKMDRKKRWIWIDDSCPTKLLRYKPQQIQLMTLINHPKNNSWKIEG